jgi:hypothetical protein
MIFGAQPGLVGVNETQVRVEHMVFGAQPGLDGVNENQVRVEHMVFRCSTRT